MSSFELFCRRCETVIQPSLGATACHCGGELTVRYDVPLLQKSGRVSVLRDSRGIWRYSSLLPVSSEDSATFGEGGTPLRPLPSLGTSLGIPLLYIKEDDLNPSGTSAARGLAVTFAVARGLNAPGLSLSGSGSIAMGFAAYAARTGIPASIRLGIPNAETAAHCRLLDARLLQQSDPELPSSVDFAPLYAIYGIEGFKTLAFEVTEQLGWALPDVILCPPGSQAVVSGLQKALDELRELGWLEHSTSCDILIPPVLSAQHTAEVIRQLARMEGKLVHPATATCFAALKSYVASGQILPRHKVVVLSLESFCNWSLTDDSGQLRRSNREQDKLGGLITPR